MEENRKSPNEEELQTTSNKNNTVKNFASEKAKKEIKKKVVSGAGKKSLIAALGPILMWAAIIIFAIIIIVGIVTFLMTMPGMVMSKLKEFAEDIGKSIASYFGANEITFVDDEEIYEVLDYFEDMGYDLKGYGFLTDFADKDDHGNLIDDEDDGVIRHTDGEKDGKIKEAESEFIFTYLVSDNYIYTVKNFNLDTQDENGKGFWNGLWTGLKGIGARALGRVINTITLGTVNNFENEQWGKGMIGLYFDKGLGVQGDFYGNGLKTDWGKLFKWPPEWPTEYNNIELDAEKKTLKIKRGLFGREIEYNLEGWTGRYGMPLEFLLSIHIGTMMPDLAFDMAETFPTEVKIFLHSQDGTYYPYIAEVVDHWYRNTYFVKKMDKELVQSDLDYEDVMKERWTLYETYTDGDLKGEYKLYIVNSEGEYAKSEAEIRNYSKASSKIEKDGEYFIFKGTQNDASSYGLSVTKKAETIDAGELEDYLEDVGWKLNGESNMWTAYDDEDGSIEQTGEGLRGETNPVIKRMFLYNTYFRYDGTPEVAEAITQLRNENDLPYGALDYTYDLSVNDDALEKVKTEVHIDNGGKEETKQYSIKDVSGKVSLNQDSLNAFSILENVHTLDTDYIYRDFKELVVELGYFTKEELTDETPRLLGWLVPDAGSYEYPDRELDKTDYEFGTMVHSLGDINAFDSMRIGAYMNGVNVEPTEAPEGADRLPDEYTEEERSTNREISAQIEAGKGSLGAINSVVGGAPNISPARYKLTPVNGGGRLNYYLSINGIDNYEVWTQTAVTCTLYSYAFICHVYTDKPMDLYLKKSNSDSFINENGRGDGQNEWWHNGLNASFEHEGIEGETIFASGDEETTTKVARALARGIPVYFYGDYMASAGYHAVVLLGASTDGKIILYNPGPGIVYEEGSASKDFGTNLDEFFAKHFKHYIFIPDEPPKGAKRPGKPYIGFEGNEAVVSPATGILLEYGTYVPEEEETEDERVNVDLKYGHDYFHKETADDEDANKEETIVKDRVGYAKIMLLDAENYRKLEQYTGSYWASDGKSLVNKNSTSNSARKILEDKELKSIEDLDNEAKWTELNKTVYGYKEFAEKYEMGGIAGNIIYVDGFVCQDVDSEIKDLEEEIPSNDQLTIDDFRITDVEDVENARDSLFKADDDYKSVSDSHTKRIEVENELMSEAVPSLEVNAGGEKLIFIKEGTVLGRTMTDKELLEASYFRNGEYGTYKEARKPEIGNQKQIIGNYLRMIFRDKDGTVIENVEDYLKLDEDTDEENENQGDKFSVVGTVFPENEWVELTYAYTSGRSCDSIFKDKQCLAEFYQICVDNGVNPEFAFVRAIQESSLTSPNGNYWGLGTPNGAELASYGTWQVTLKEYCKWLNKYQDPSSDSYSKIMSRYNERKACKENGGIDPNGYGKPNTAQGIQSIYSYLGKHEYGSPGAGGYYYMDPARAGVTKIYKTHEEFESKCHTQGGVHAEGTETTIWEQGQYTAWQVDGIVRLAKQIYGPKAGTYEGVGKLGKD